MNVKYYISTGQKKDPNLLLISVSGQHFVYENLAAHPYFDFVHRYRVIENPDEALATVLGPAFSAKQEVILEKAPPDFAVSGVDSAALSSVQDEIEYLGVRDFYSPIQNTFQFRVRAEHPGFVLLSNNYHYQWKATVDGTDTEIYQANYLWMGVFVPEGDHDVVFTFNPSEILYSRMASFIGMLIFGILLVVTFALEKRAPKMESTIPE
ncbi:YfhO family protein [candidate division KSB1 bacterium]|nr:YfhO family protein [candidate division KSB1 bacterium]